jgi:hypothetical protein
MKIFKRFKTASRYTVIIQRNDLLPIRTSVQLLRHTEQQALWPQLHRLTIVEYKSCTSSQCAFKYKKN